MTGRLPTGVEWDSNRGHPKLMSYGSPESMPKSIQIHALAQLNYSYPCRFILNSNIWLLHVATVHPVGKVSARSV